MSLLPDDLIQRLRTAPYLAAITGAGISTESGLPTYRGKGGLLHHPVEGPRRLRVLSAPHLKTNPAETWELVFARLRSTEDTPLGVGHRALVEIEERAKRFVLVTQNVDGLHTRAGSRKVVEIHGNVFQGHCLECGATRSFGDDDPDTLVGVPECLRCGNDLRPDVVLFQEHIPPVKTQALKAALAENVPDVLIVVGTTATYSHIRLPIKRAFEQGSIVIDINPEETKVAPYATHCFRRSAADVLPIIADAMA